MEKTLLKETVDCLKKTQLPSCERIKDFCMKRIYWLPLHRKNDEKGRYLAGVKNRLAMCYNLSIRIISTIDLKSVLFISLSSTVYILDETNYRERVPVSPWNTR